MNGVVTIHPGFDQGERGASVRKRGNADIIALEGSDEGFGHAVAFWALDGGEAGFEIERHRDLDRLVSREDRSIVRQPLHAMRCTEGAKAALYALNHHVPDHLA